MVRARSLTGDGRDELQLGFAWLGLPSSAGEYILERMTQLQVLLTGLSKDEGRFLRGLAEGGSDTGREEYPAYVAGDVRRCPGTALLSGRKEQVERVIRAANGAGWTGLAKALEQLLETQFPQTPPKLIARTCDGHPDRVEGPPSVLGLARERGIPFTLVTSDAQAAREGLRAGADAIACERWDSELLGVIADHQASAFLMGSAEEAVEAALAAGISKERVCVDPGEGDLGLRRLADLHTLGAQVRIQVDSADAAGFATLLGRPHWIVCDDVAKARASVERAWRILHASPVGRMADRPLAGRGTGP